MIVPSDADHDFTPIAAPHISVGQEVVIQAETVGEVTAVAGGPPGAWIFLIDDTAIAFFRDEPPYPDSYGTVYLYRRQPKPARGALLTAADGSRWVYPALPHGQYRCWQAGTTHGEGLASRAEIEGLVAD